ncbi:MAG: hypothetical protein ACR2HH_10845 [Chthoniobacterales bacterium]
MQFFFKWRNSSAMESSSNDDEQNDSANSESRETPARAKIRDLRPEKDPMGAGGKIVLIANEPTSR